MKRLNVPLFVALVVMAVLISSPAYPLRYLTHQAVTFEDDPIRIEDINIREIWKERRYESFIRCTVELKNAPRAVEAYAIGFVFYDVFNDYLSTYRGISMNEINENNEVSTTWDFTPHWGFDRHEGWMAYTAIVYVDRVRFADGSVWKQDRAKLSDKIKEIGVLFQEEQLIEPRIVVGRQ